MTEAALLASTLAAVVSRSIMHPMDTLRLRLQVGDLSTNHLNNPTVVSKVVSTSSTLRQITSLYSGYSVAISFTVPGLAVFLTSYDLTKSALSRYSHLDTNHTLNHCISGFVAQGLAGLVFNPMEVVKGFMQTRSPSNPLPLRHIIQSVYRNQGAVGFFRGYWLSVAVFGPHNIIYFSTYEKLKSILISRHPDNHLELNHFLFASSAATLLGATLTHPIDVLRARYQVYNTSRSMLNEKSLHSQLSVAQYAYHMWHEEGGLRPFMRGAMYRVGYLVPSTALSMTMFETFKPLFLQLLNRPSSTLL